MALYRQWATTGRPDTLDSLLDNLRSAIGAGRIRPSDSAMLREHMPELSGNSRFEACMRDLGNRSKSNDL